MVKAGGETLRRSFVFAFSSPRPAAQVLKAPGRWIMPRYKMVEIHTGEEARWRHRPVHSAVIEYVSSLKIPARTLMTRGIGRGIRGWGNTSR